MRLSNKDFCFRVNSIFFKSGIYKFVLATILLATFHVNGNAQEKDSTINHIFILIYNQQFNQAETMLNAEDAKLDPFYTLVLNTDLLWWKYSISNSKEDAQNLKNELNKFEIPGENNQLDKIYELIRKSYELRYERKRYNYIGVIFIRSDINKLLSEINSEEITISGEQLELFQLYIAMFQYFEFINPVSIFNKPDERLIPLRKMEKFASENDLILNTLAHYFLGRIYQKVEKEQQKAKVHFEVLSEKFPENKLFKEYVEECAAKM